MGLKEWWKRLKYWKRGLYTTLVIYLLLNILYLGYTTYTSKKIICLTFGGGFKCNIFEFLFTSLAGFPWYFIFIGLPIIIIFG